MGGFALQDMNIIWSSDSGTDSSVCLRFTERDGKRGQLLSLDEFNKHLKEKGYSDITCAITNGINWDEFQAKWSHCVNDGQERTLTATFSKSNGNKVVKLEAQGKNVPLCETNGAAYNGARVHNVTRGTFIKYLKRVFVDITGPKSIFHLFKKAEGAVQPPSTVSPSPAPPPPAAQSPAAQPLNKRLKVTLLKPGEEPKCPQVACFSSLCEPCLSDVIAVNYVQEFEAQEFEAQEIRDAEEEHERFLDHHCYPFVAELKTNESALLVVPVQKVTIPPTKIGARTDKKRVNSFFINACCHGNYCVVAR